jgi:Peptidase A4 family
MSDTDGTPPAETDYRDSDVISLMHTYEPPPRGFAMHSAEHRELQAHGIPRRPHPDREPRLTELWNRHVALEPEMIRAELEIDPVMSRRNPLHHGGERAAEAGFGPSGWGGAVVTTGSLGYSPPEPANNVFAQWTVPGIWPASNPNAPITAGFWVGIDGWGNGQVLQAGIAVTVQPNATVNWWAWTEWYTTQYKDPAVAVTNFPINVGDTVSVLVCASQPNHGFVSLHNITTNQATSVGLDARPGITSQGASAECIIEGISADLPVFLPSVTFSSFSAGTQHHSFDLQPTGITTNITGTNGVLTQTTIASPTAAIVQWKGWT